MRYDLLKLELFGPDGTPCTKKILVPTTPHRLPISSHAQTIQKLWKEGIDATGFLIPDEELARLSLDNPSWPPNNVFIARADLSRQWDQYAPKQPPSDKKKDGAEGSLPKEPVSTPASPVQQPPKSTGSSVTRDRPSRLKPLPPHKVKLHPSESSVTHESSLRPVERQNRLKPRAPDKGDKS